MKEFNYRQAQLGARLRYVILGLVALFIGAMPMPVDKQFLAWLCVANGLANLVYHVTISVTRRSGVATYVMASCETLLMIAGIYQTGLLVSPFLALLPLNFFTVYFATFNSRVTIAFGVAVIVLMAALFTVWLFFGSTMPAWPPRAYIPFALLLFSLQMFAVGSYLYLSVQTNPFLVEIQRQQQAMLGQQHRAEIGTAMAMITHEIRTPLSTAYASVDLAIGALHKGGTTANIPEAHKRLAVAFAEMQRLNEMLDSVLSYSRNKRGQLKPANYWLRELIERALGFITLKYGRHAVKYTAEYRFDRAQRVWCDRDAMHQVLVNLLDNAMQHRSPDRPMRFEFSSFAHPTTLVVTVRDNGKGIPGEILPKIFVQYMTSREGGTGLGLAIVRQLIEDHHGKIEVQSTEGVGTIFTIVLPLSDAFAIDGSPVRAAAPAPSR